jgi:polyvinyl alcohol dehydrogenase (cytochrome)
MILFAILCFVYANANQIILQGYDQQNTRDFPSLIGRVNINRLTLAWNATMCGSATATPLIINGMACISDFGSCYTCHNATTGAIIFRKSYTTDYGFPAGLQGRGMPTYDPQSGLVIMATSNLKFLGPSGGSWVFGVRLSDGVMVWKTVVSNNIWSLVSQSVLIAKGRVYLGISSSESSRPYIYPNETQYNFTGTFYSFNATNGQLLWSISMIPAKYAGMNYSGAGIWGSTPALGLANDIYFGTGELNSAPDNVTACSNANPLNTSCVPPDVLFDSIVRVNMYTGQIMNTFRTSAADTWNLACYFDQIGIPLPGCSTLSFAYDYDVTTIQVSSKTGNVYAGSKSGFKWAFTQNLTYRWSQLAVAGSIIGGYSWQGALRDSYFPRLTSVFGAETNGNSLVVTLPNGTNVTSGVWTSYDGNGNVNWITPAPNGDQVYGAVTLTNGLVFGQTKVLGLLVAMDAHTGEIVWTYQTNGSMNGAPAVIDRWIFWGTGPGNNAGPPTVDQNQFLAFNLAPFF